MKAFITSDIHIQKTSDDSAKFLINFIESALTHKPDRVYFLGDIFDYMVGEHTEYLEKYDFFFNGVRELVEAKIEVFYFEGNHDFHLKKVFIELIQKYNLDEDLIHYCQASIVEQLDGRQVWFGHGDVLDYNNVAYKRWKKIYTSKYMHTFVSNILSFKMVQKIGSWASQDSRNRKSKKFDYQSAKAKYRTGAEILSENGYDIIVAGHTHIEDDYHGSSGHGKFQYINNGYPVKTRKIIVYDKGFTLVPLDSFF
jgi:UDP-2,3-diacylglucosamine hydrolase